MTTYKDGPVVYVTYHDYNTNKRPREDPYTPDVLTVGDEWVTMLWLFDADAEPYGNDNIRRKVRVPIHQVQCLHTIEREERPDDE